MILDITGSIVLIVIFILIIIPFVTTSKITRLENKQVADMSVIAQTKMADLRKTSYNSLNNGTYVQYYPINGNKEVDTNKFNIVNQKPVSSNFYKITSKVSYVNPEDVNTQISQNKNVKRIDVLVEGPFKNENEKNVLTNRDLFCEILTIKCNYESKDYYDKG